MTGGSYVYRGRGQSVVRAVKVVVIGGSSANVGKTTFGVQVARQARQSQRIGALTVDVQDGHVATEVRLDVSDGGAKPLSEAARYLTAGVAFVVTVTVSRACVREGSRRQVFGVRGARVQTFLSSIQPPLVSR